jgi:hypothetical protein
MARANLRGLVGNLGETDVSNQAADADGAAPATRAPQAKPVGVDAPTSTVSTPPKPDRPAPTDQPSPRTESVPRVQRYSDFARKETRLRVAQQDALTEHARRLNRLKGPGGQRITDNTLIRVAVDWLLSKADRLDGRDEAELRRSVGLKGAES